MAPGRRRVIAFAKAIILYLLLPCNHKEERQLSWFPLPEGVMESPEFKMFTPTEKLYLWLLISEYNLRDGGFYLADLEVAKTLATSEKTIRRARAKPAFREWVSFVPGTRDKRGRGIATRYLEVKCASLGDYGWFAQMHRYTFNMMLNCLRHKTFQPGDVVVYVYLSYWYWKCRGRYADREKFFITKRELRELTNLENAPERVARLYSNFTYSGGAHLFEYSGYQRLEFTKWATAADPEKDENNRKNAERWIQEIKEQVKKAKQDKQAREKVKRVAGAEYAAISPEDLPDLFDRLYQQKYGRLQPYRWGGNRWDRLVEYGELYGAGRVFQAMMFYFNAGEVPNTTHASTRTIANFLMNIEELLRRATKGMAS